MNVRIWMTAVLQAAFGVFAGLFIAEAIAATHDRERRGGGGQEHKLTAKTDVLANSEDIRIQAVQELQVRDERY